MAFIRPLINLILLNDKPIFRQKGVLSMGDETLISHVQYTPCIRNKSLIGFIDFVYRGKFKFIEAQVHERLDKKGYRIVYPKNSYPVNKETQTMIDEYITQHIKGAKDDKSTGINGRHKIHDEQNKPK